MELIKLSVAEFADVLGSDAPAPGGGSTAALSGVMGASLISMVCALTAGKKKYEEFRELAEETGDKALALKDDLLSAVDRDTEAFNVVSAAFSMPKQTDGEKQARSAAIQKGLTACIESPLAIMDLSLQALRLAEALPGRFNTAAASDLGVAVLMLRSAVLGAWLNVKINLGSLKDREQAEAYRARAGALLEEAERITEDIYGQVNDLLE